MSISISNITSYSWTGKISIENLFELNFLIQGGPLNMKTKHHVVPHMYQILAIKTILILLKRNC